MVSGPSPLPFFGIGRYSQNLCGTGYKLPFLISPESLTWLIANGQEQLTAQYQHS